MKRTLVIAAGILALAFANIITVTAPLSAQTATAQAAALEQSATFIVDNMTCGLCPITVKKAMEGVAGVSAVEIDFDAKTASVQFDPNVATVEAIAAASENAGYPARKTD